MPFGDIVIIVSIVLLVVGGGFYFFNRWAAKKTVEQQNVIEKVKQQASIYVIDKKRDKAENVTLPKAISDKLPKVYKFMKMYFVKAKIGPQITTLMCEKKVFDNLEPKKTYKVEVAGIYIVSVKGMKTPQEIKEQEKIRKKKEKEEIKAAKKAVNEAKK